MILLFLQMLVLYLVVFVPFEPPMLSHCTVQLVLDPMSKVPTNSLPAEDTLVTVMASRDICLCTTN